MLYTRCVAGFLALGLCLLAVAPSWADRQHLAPAAFFYHHSTEVEAKDGRDPSDPHSPSKRRARSALCLLYDRFRDPAIGQELGTAAANCPARAERTTADWNARLAPYTRLDTGLTF